VSPYSRCTERSALLPSKLIKQWELPLHGFFTAGASKCSTTSDLSSENPLCNLDASPGGFGVVDFADSSTSNSIVTEASRSSSHTFGIRLHLMSLRQTPSLSDSSFAFACKFFQQQQSLDTSAADIEIASLPDFKLPLLNRNCILRMCDASQAESDLCVDDTIHDSALQPTPPSYYALIKQTSGPSFESYESKFRFLDSQIPLVVRPAVSCIFTAAISAANASTCNPHAEVNLATLANSTAAVHPCSLSPTRKSKLEKQGKSHNSASVRFLKQQSKRLKASEGPLAVSANHLLASALPSSQVVSDVIRGDLTTFAFCKGTSATPSIAADVAKLPPIVSAGSSGIVKSVKKSSAYELLKSKLWSKLHTKFRRETQPPVDVVQLKIVFNR
jgi:hypothetical protein